MTADQYLQLARRAYPPGGVRPWRRRIAVTVAVVFVLTAARQPFPAVLMLASTVPTMVRYVRRELALGALLSIAHQVDAEHRSIPLRDLRDTL